ncbi:MAG: DUF1501 domain-containing protein [Gemmataceae bacterium]|nr:DUF1501 domain-containing protein [Gemmataceae bacterium]
MSFFRARNRRRFLRDLVAIGGASASVLSSSSWAALPSISKVGLRRRKSLIVIWLDGGPSHIDLWSVGRHVGSPNQGPFQPIKTSARGIEISEVLPKVAEQFKHLSVIRTLDSREGDFARATTRMLTGMPVDDRGMRFPHLGAVVARHVGNPFMPLRFVSVGGTALRIGGGFLGPAYAPLLVANAGTAPENLRAPTLGDPEMTEARAARRAELLLGLEDGFTDPLSADPARSAAAAGVREHKQLVEGALELSQGTLSKLFEFDRDDMRRIEEYGNNGFGRGCLLARKLVEAGVSSVQVDLGGWNMHGNSADGVRRLATGVLDPALAALVRDLGQSGKLQETLIVCLSQFGRSPRINANAGRSTWSHGWDIVLGGAGFRRGVEYGTMEVGGMAIKQNPVSVPQLYATMYAALGIAVKDRTFQRDHLGVGTNDEIIEPIRDLLS